MTWTPRQPDIIVLPVGQALGTFIPPPPSLQRPTRSPFRLFPGMGAMLTRKIFRLGGRQLMLPSWISNFSIFRSRNSLPYTMVPENQSQEDIALQHDKVLLRRAYIIFILSMFFLGYWIWMTGIGDNGAGSNSNSISPNTTSLIEDSDPGEKSNFVLMKNLPDRPKSEKPTEKARDLFPTFPNVTKDGRMKVEFIKVPTVPTTPIVNTTIKVKIPNSLRKKIHLSDFKIDDEESDSSTYRNREKFRKSKIKYIKKDPVFGEGPNIWTNTFEAKAKSAFDSQYGVNPDKKDGNVTSSFSNPDPPLDQKQPEFSLPPNKEHPLSSVKETEMGQGAIPLKKNFTEKVRSESQNPASIEVTNARNFPEPPFLNPNFKPAETIRHSNAGSEDHISSNGGSWTAIKVKPETSTAHPKIPLILTRSPRVSRINDNGEVISQLSTEEPPPVELVNNYF